MAKGTVGVVGLGIMGGAFAKNLAAAGWRVVGFDVDPGRRRAMARHGVEIAPDAGRSPAGCRPSSPACPSPPRSTPPSRRSSAPAAPARDREASTFTLADKTRAERALRKAGHVMLDCPVSGTGAQAKVKDLVIYASGNSRAIRRLRPLFATFARAVHDLGDFGNGSRMKYVANLLVAINNVASAEAMVLGLKAGLDPRRCSRW